MEMPRSGFAGAVTCIPSACNRSTTSFQLEASAKAPCTRTTVGWDASCGFSLKSSSLVEGPEAELLRLAPLCEGQRTLLVGTAHPQRWASLRKRFVNGPRTSETSENGTSRRLGE